MVAALLARVATLTDEEIDTAQVPLKWYKDALREARSREQRVTFLKQIAEAAEAAGLPEVIETSENLKRGRRILYTGPGTYAKNTRGVVVEIKQDDWFFIPHDMSGAWQNQVFFADLPEEVLRFTQEIVADETRWDYIIAWAEELPKRYGGDIPHLL